MKQFICSQCVMDTTDPMIFFNEDGICNHCIKFRNETSKHWFPDSYGQEKLNQLLEQIKEDGKSKEYDCIIGLSGGLDSSYLALKAKDWGLRPLVVHVDAGWNSELAVINIEKILKYCDYELHTHVVDWSEMRELQLAYLRSGIANQDVPQDHIFFSTLNHFAANNGIRYFLSGGNIATESILPRSWQGSAMDALNLKAINKKFGISKLKNYKTISFFEYYVKYPVLKKIKTVRPLNLMPYDKSKALNELQELVGYKPYLRKHGESFFTKFFQNYWLPTKYGYDKRKPHLSSMILSGQISREEALQELEKPLYNTNEIEEDITYLCKKLRISRDEFDEIMKIPNCHYTDFTNWDFRFKVLRFFKRALDRVIGKRFQVTH